MEIGEEGTRNQREREREKTLVGEREMKRQINKKDVVLRDKQE